MNPPLYRLSYAVTTNANEFESGRHECAPLAGRHPGGSPGKFWRKALQPRGIFAARRAEPERRQPWLKSSGELSALPRVLQRFFPPPGVAGTAGFGPPSLAWPFRSTAPRFHGRRCGGWARSSLSAFLPSLRGGYRGDGRRLVPGMPSRDCLDFSVLCPVRHPPGQSPTLDGFLGPPRPGATLQRVRLSRAAVRRGCRRRRLLRAPANSDHPLQVPPGSRRPSHFGGGSLAGSRG